MIMRPRVRSVKQMFLSVNDDLGVEQSYLVPYSLVSPFKAFSGRRRYSALSKNPAQPQGRTGTLNTMREGGHTSTKSSKVVSTLL